jgi:hypothetical protein
MKTTISALALCMAILFFTSQVISQDVTISQFKMASYSDFLIDRSGTYHAVFLETPDIGKPVFVYYTRSTNQGRAWTKPVTISNDGSGNGSGYARLIENGSGEVFAIWKRMGNTANLYPVANAILEGPGGYDPGTLYFRVVSGGGMSDIIPINDQQAVMFSWFPALNPQGNVVVVWSQISEESNRRNWRNWGYADWIRAAVINSGGVGQPVALTTPSAPQWAGGPPPSNGLQNLHGYITREGVIRFVAEGSGNDGRFITHFDGRNFRQIYGYPKFKTFNTFMNPPRLLLDQQGREHIIFMPDSSMLEGNEIWDYEVATNRRAPVVSIQQQGMTLNGMQAYQGPGGKMVVTFQAGKLSESNESWVGEFSDGTWRIFSMTKNSANDSFFSRELPFNGLYIPVISGLTRFRTNYVAVAYDPSGTRKMLMTLAEWFTSSFASTSKPSVVFLGGGRPPAAAPANRAPSRRPVRRQ